MNLPVLCTIHDSFRFVITLVNFTETSINVCTELFQIETLKLLRYKKKFQINMGDTLRFVVMLSPDLIALEANRNSKTQFLTVPGSLSVDELIAKACESWLIEPEMYNQYCLIFDDASRKYLTEGKTRHTNYISVLIKKFHRCFILVYYDV